MTATLRGIYVLIISVSEDVELEVGRLGTLEFKQGLYAYAGSAQRNLEKRVKRHLSRNKRKFWHVDYLLDHEAVEIVEVLYKKGEKSEECGIGERLAGRGGVVVSRFGSSDCNCKGHLFLIDNCNSLKGSMSNLDLTEGCDEKGFDRIRNYGYDEKPSQANLGI